MLLNTWLIIFKWFTFHMVNYMSSYNLQSTFGAFPKWFQLLLLLHHFIQGDPNQNFWFQMAPQLKQCIFDPKLVKSKLVWKAVVFYGRKKFFEKSWKVKSFSKSKNIFLHLVGFEPGTSWLPAKCLIH